MPYHTIDSMNWRPKDDAVIPRWVTIKKLRVTAMKFIGQKQLVYIFVIIL